MKNKTTTKIRNNGRNNSKKQFRRVVSLALLALLINAAYALRTFECHAKCEENQCHGPEERHCDVCAGDLEYHVDRCICGHGWFGPNGENQDDMNQDCVHYIPKCDIMEFDSEGEPSCKRCYYES